MKNESDYKTALVKELRKGGAYARRIEDQYAVGVLDMHAVIPGIPVTLFIEGKVVRNNKFAPTPRQYEEGKRINAAGCKSDSALAALVGFKESDVYLADFAESATILSPDVCKREEGESAVDFFNRWYHRRK